MQQHHLRASNSIAKALLPKTASLEQAGGLHRMVLRGHSGPVQKVLLTPGGTDVVTGTRLLHSLSAHNQAACIVSPVDIDVITGKYFSHSLSEHIPAAHVSTLVGVGVVTGTRPLQIYLHVSKPLISSLLLTPAPAACVPERGRTEKNDLCCQASSWECLF